MIHIAPAQRTDLPLILAFIREFAEHIQSADQVSATPAALDQTLFGDRRYAEVLLANARANYIQALYDYKVSEARIEKAMGINR